MTQSIKRIKASDGTGNASVATVTSLRTAPATQINVDTVVGIYAGSEGFYATMGTPHTFTDPVTGETITEISEASAVNFQGHIDTGHIIIDAIAPGYTDLGSKVGDIVIIRPTTQYADNLADTLAVSHNEDGTLNPPQGSLINGKLVPSIATNNLTVALKTLAGADPSATDIVQVRIGDTVHKITSALSVTLAAGTNWFGKSTLFAGVATNFYVYLGYNTTDGVTMGVANTPTALFYGNFSTTNTAWTYAKISTITHAASTDVYECVGRFNAILGASATYNWSLPAGNFSIAQPSRQVVQAPCEFLAYKSSPSSLNNNTVVVYDTVYFDSGSNYSNSTGKFTAPVTGFYQFNAQIYYSSGVASNYRCLALKNGSSLITAGARTNTGTADTSSEWSDIIPLVAGDYIQIVTFCPSPTSVFGSSLIGLSKFSGFLVKPV